MAEKWFAVIDSDGNAVSFGTVLAEPEELEANGLTAVKVTEDDVQSPDRVWDASKKTFIDAPPPELTPEQQTAEQLIAEARADLSSSSASKAAKREAAAFLKTMGELR